MCRTGVSPGRVQTGHRLLGRSSLSLRWSRGVARAARRSRAPRSAPGSASRRSRSLLQTAVYCGTPDANIAFRIAGGVLAEHHEQEGRRG